MKTLSPTPTRAGACTTSSSALAQLLQNCPLARSAKADLKNGTWTFDIQGAQVGSGAYALIPARLLNQAIAQDCQAALQRLENSVVLPATGKTTARFFTVGGQTALQLDGAHGFHQTLYRDHMPEVNRSRDWHPSHWYGTPVRQDEQGRDWRGSTEIYVTDDFGDLVEVRQ